MTGPFGRALEEDVGAEGADRRLVAEVMTTADCDCAEAAIAFVRDAAERLAAEDARDWPSAVRFGGLTAHAPDAGDPSCRALVLGTGYETFVLVVETSGDAASPDARPVPASLRVAVTGRDVRDTVAALVGDGHVPNGVLELDVGYEVDGTWHDGHRGCHDVGRWPRLFRTLGDLALAKGLGPVLRAGRDGMASRADRRDRGPAVALGRLAAREDRYRGGYDLVTAATDLQGVACAADLQARLDGLVDLVRGCRGAGAVDRGTALDVRGDVAAWAMAEDLLLIEGRGRTTEVVLHLDPRGDLAGVDLLASPQHRSLSGGGRERPTPVAFLKVRDGVVTCPFAPVVDADRVRAWNAFVDAVDAVVPLVRPTGPGATP